MTRLSPRFKPPPRRERICAEAEHSSADALTESYRQKRLRRMCRRRAAAVPAALVVTVGFRCGGGQLGWFGGGRGGLGPAAGGRRVRVQLKLLAERRFLGGVVYPRYRRRA